MNITAGDSSRCGPDQSSTFDPPFSASDQFWYASGPNDVFTDNSLHASLKRTAVAYARIASDAPALQTASGKTRVRSELVRLMCVLNSKIPDRLLGQQSHAGGWEWCTPLSFVPEVEHLLGAVQTYAPVEMKASLEATLTRYNGSVDATRSKGGMAHHVKVPQAAAELLAIENACKSTEYEQAADTVT